MIIEQFAGAMERSRVARQTLHEANELLRGMLQEQLRRFLKAGDVVPSESGAEHTAFMTILSGHARGAHRFMLIEEPVIGMGLLRGEPSNAVWSAQVNPVRADGTPGLGVVWLQSPLFTLDLASPELRDPELERAYTDAYISNWLGSQPQDYQSLSLKQFLRQQRGQAEQGEQSARERQRA